MLSVDKIIGRFLCYTDLHLQNVNIVFKMDDWANGFKIAPGSNIAANIGSDIESNIESNWVLLFYLPGIFVPGFKSLHDI